MRHALGAALTLSLLALAWFAGPWQEPRAPLPQAPGPALGQRSADPPPPANPSPDRVPGELIVKLRPDIPPPMRERLLQAQDLQLKRELSFPGFALVTYPPHQNPASMAVILSSNPAIEYAEPNYYAYAAAGPEDPYLSFQWHLALIQVPQAWELSTGRGVTVAVIDTGVAYEDFGPYVKAPDLAGTAFAPGWDFVNNDPHPNDDQRHGTHVAGTIAQTTHNGVGVAGVAYEARIMPVKVLDANGVGTYSNVAEGIKWAVDHGAQVINLSLGGSPYSALLEEAVNYAHSRGVVVVAAAGNADRPTVDYPAALERAIAVGAVRLDGTRAPYSNYGAALDLMAPGGDLSQDQNRDGYGDGVLQETFNPQDPRCEPKPCYSRFAYYFFQGTSMATAHVSGVAALLIARGRATNPEAVRAALESTAKELGEPGWDSFYGHGLIQARAALELGATPTPLPAPQQFLPWGLRGFRAGW